MKPQQPSFITDTHPLLRYLLNKHNKLSKKVLETFRSADAGEIEILVPTPVIWEITILCKRGKIKPLVPLAVWFDQLLGNPGFKLLPLEVKDFLIAAELTFSIDEFDVLIVANALRTGTKLITNDGVLHDVKPCKLYW